VGDVLNLATGVTLSPSILSAGVGRGTSAVLYYDPAGSALDQVPASQYSVQETLADYTVDSGGIDNFLEIVLSRIESRYGLTGFASSFTADFETFLRNVDLDTATPGLQPYLDPSGRPILTIADTHFFGPEQTWPRELYNHPYIEFWHRLDAALLARTIPGMGPELLGDAAWRSLFSSGNLAENPRIQISVSTSPRLSVQRLSVDQRGTARAPGAPGDIGAIELR